MASARARLTAKSAAPAINRSLPEINPANDDERGIVLTFNTRRGERRKERFTRALAAFRVLEDDNNSDENTVNVPNNRPLQFRAN